MIYFWTRCVTGVAVMVSSALTAFGQTAPLPTVPRMAAPPPAMPPLLRDLSEMADEIPVSAAAALTLYSIGEPTNDEQLYLELINRARANPPAEGLRLAFTADAEVRSAIDFFVVDTNALVAAFNVIAPAPPLAMNAQLTIAARLHSLDMFTNAFQEHVGSDGRTLGQRATAAGYLWTLLGENIFSYAKSTWHGHAGFQIDWGFGPGGMQSPPGHRNTIHNAALHEVGIGIVTGLNTVAGETVGPQVVTQDFGNGPAARPFLTGVVYYDLNGNNFYDAGEGLRGVRVDVSGATQYAVSAGSGGFTVPANNGTRTVTFSRNGLPTTTRTVAFANNNNVKADLVLAYTAPVITGPSSVSANSSNLYAFSPVPGALSYELSSRRLQPYTAVEGAEGGATNFTAAISPGYDPVVTDVWASGAKSLHLAMPTIEDQSLTLNRVLRPGANGALVFASRLGWATPTQVARVLVSTNEGLSWVELWSRTGTGTSGQAIFSRVTNSLSAFARRELKCRFLYDFTGGSGYPQTTAGIGWYLDDIAFLDTQEIAGATTQTIASGTNFVFSPSQTGSQVLRVRPLLGNTFGPSGPALNVTVTPEILAMQVTRIESPGGSQLRIEVQVLSGTVGTLALERRNSFEQNWTADSGATLTTVTPGSVYRFTTTTSGSTQRFYRVRSQ